MSAKHTDDNRPSGPCLTASEMDQVREAVGAPPPKRIGDLNGHWAALLKVSIVIVPLFFPIFIGWATWTTQRITENDRELALVRAQVTTVARDLMPMEQRLRVFTSRAEWEMSVKNNSREFEAITVSIKELSAKLDRLLESRNGRGDQ